MKKKYHTVVLTCERCGCSVTLPEWEAQAGMRCPGCHREKLQQPLEERPGKGKAGRVVRFRLDTIRALVGGGISLVLGPVLLSWGSSHLGGKAAAERFWLSIIALGICFIITAVLLLIIGIVGLCRDLR
jgi:hypothetical protein